jgi:hypothetical protein
MSARFRASIPILPVAALVVVADLALVPIFQVSGYLPSQAPTIAVLAWDFGIVLGAGLAGLFLAPRVGSPIWWRARDGSRASRRTTMITVLLGVFVVAYNTLSVVIYAVIYADQMTAGAPWITALTPGRAIALALRAALNEEIVFRLFLFPLVAWGVGYFLRCRRASLLIGASVSALAFGLIHPGFWSAFLIGLALVYIYHQRGLLPAMVVHFFTDAIPYTLVSMVV